MNFFAPYVLPGGRSVSGASAMTARMKAMGGPGRVLERMYQAAYNDGYHAGYQDGFQECLDHCREQQQMASRSAPKLPAKT
ncbi:hypothetical protein DB032_19580 [Chromobacterium sp. Panama]|uniref:hypothetical protein n=1 Tax=Chromobacterium sp. Panama TaxID=2161826 RepID=UPI000D4F0224|nr:hypothetical protein [Chromobacterium sp. Panama]PTU66966.1 hypothetical protein DB032_19580 [Chromobacterium sp. Panama]